MRNTFKCALHSIAATRAHVRPPPVQVQRDLKISVLKPYSAKYIMK